jgi:uncharacterized protein YndB with AHSA1/START domain/DNA-binding transcriptional ArsR family regulator
VDAQQVLATIGEPTRFRIVALLADGPRTIGELTSALGALQPQTTKHVQALEAAGVIRVQRLGRRRLASLDRESLRRLGAWFAGLAEQTDDDRALETYAAGIASVERRAAVDSAAAVAFTLERSLPASRDAVWRAWTDPGLAAGWWAPRHFEVVRAAIAPAVGAPVELVLREGDGTEYASAGTVRDVDPSSRLLFDLSPLGADGAVVFPVEVEVRLEPEAVTGTETTLSVSVRASTTDPAAAPMLAGLEPGWSQQLERLAELLALGHDGDAAAARHRDSHNDPL